MPSLFGTTETLISGVYSPFSFRTILGDGFLYTTYLKIQDVANFWIALAILVAIGRRVFKSSPRLSSLPKTSRFDAYLVLAWIFGLVFTASVSLGARAYAGMLPAEPLGISRSFASIFTMFGMDSAESWQTL